MIVTLVIVANVLCALVNFAYAWSLPARRGRHLLCAVVNVAIVWWLVQTYG